MSPNRFATLVGAKYYQFGISQILVCIGLIACLVGCAEAPRVRVFDAEAYPNRLSDWGILWRDGQRLMLGENVVAYDINTPLFSDYALKLRTVWMPPGENAVFDERESYPMPVGTIMSKTFFFPLVDYPIGDAPVGNFSLANKDTTTPCGSTSSTAGNLAPQREAMVYSDNEPSAAVAAVSVDGDRHLSKNIGDSHDTRMEQIAESNSGLGDGVPCSSAPARAGSSTRIAQATAGWDGDFDNLDLAQTKLIETRLLVKQASGWDALPYVWRGDDAWLTLTGDLQSFELQLDAASVSLDYIVPTRNDCASCHATGRSGALQTIGIKTRHLNRGYHGTGTNQLRAWQQQGLLRDVPPASTWARNADWWDGHETIAHRARSYLDANCGHCHNPDSATDTSGLWLDYQDHSPRRLGLCKPPIAAGRGTGGRDWSIAPGEPKNSILTFRLAATDPGMRMPEIGRTLAHTEAVAVVGAWIESLGGECVPMG